MEFSMPFHLKARKQGFMLISVKIVILSQQFLRVKKFLTSAATVVGFLLMQHVVELLMSPVYIFSCLLLKLLDQMFRRVCCGKVTNYSYLERNSIFCVCLSVAITEKKQDSLALNTVVLFS